MFVFLGMFGCTDPSVMNEKSVDVVDTAREDTGTDALREDVDTGGWCEDGMDSATGDTGVVVVPNDGSLRSEDCGNDAFSGLTVDYDPGDPALFDAVVGDEMPLGLFTFTGDDLTVDVAFTLWMDTDDDGVYHGMGAENGVEASSFVKLCQLEEGFATVQSVGVAAEGRLIYTDVAVSGTRTFALRCSTQGEVRGPLGLAVDVNLSRFDVTAVDASGTLREWRYCNGNGVQSGAELAPDGAVSVSPE